MTYSSTNATKVIQCFSKSISRSHRKSLSSYIRLINYLVFSNLQCHEVSYSVCKMSRLNNWNLMTQAFKFIWYFCFNFIQCVKKSIHCFYTNNSCIYLFCWTQGRFLGRFIYINLYFLGRRTIMLRYKDHINSLKHHAKKIKKCECMLKRFRTVFFESGWSSNQRASKY